MTTPASQPVVESPGKSANAPRRKKSRRLSVRTLLVLLTVVPTLALVSLLVITTLHLVPESVTLRAQTDLANRNGNPAYSLMGTLQDERRFTAAYVAAPSDATHTALVAARAKTDAAIATLKQTNAGGVPNTPSDAAAHLRDLLARTGAPLAAMRARIDHEGGEARDDAFAYYHDTVDADINLVEATGYSVSADLTYAAGVVVAQFRVIEQGAIEDTYITYAQGAGKLSPADYHAFTDAVGARRYLVEGEIDPFIPAKFAAPYAAMTHSPSWGHLLDLEDAVIAARPGPLPAELKDWRATFDDGLNQWGTFSFAVAINFIHQSDSTADHNKTSVYGLIALYGALVLVAALLCWRITRSVRRRLSELRRSTVEFGTERLPQVLDRLRRGDHVDLEAEAPELPHTGDDEIGQVADAFNQAQRAAFDGALQLARQREGFTRVFLNTALRTQSLVGRQIGELDAMERRHQDPEVLRDLFTLDHFATRLRRYEESLVILSGRQPGRRWSRPVRLIDIVRSAAGEVEAYDRIDVLSDTEATVAGGAVGGLIHLLAELLENAASFSPPETPVQVRVQSVARGVVVEIEDRGLGMSDEDYDTLNAQLANPAPFDVVALADDVRLGLFVVAQLSERSGVTVTLRSSPYGGTLAIVFVPEEIMAAPVKAGTSPSAGSGDEVSLPAQARGGDEGAEVSAHDETEVAMAVVEPVVTSSAELDPESESELELETEPETEREPAADPVPAAEPEPEPVHAGRDGDSVEGNVGDLGGKPPLPRRVRARGDVPQIASFAQVSETAGQERSPSDSAATVSLFQQGTEQARAAQADASGSTSDVTDAGIDTHPGDQS